MALGRFDPVTGEIMPAPSNSGHSRLPVTDSTGIFAKSGALIGASIDRLSFVVSISPEALPALDRYLQNSTALSEPKHSGVFGFRHAYKVGTGDGTMYLEVGDRASGATNGNGKKVRIDYNPNNVQLGLIEEMRSWVNDRPWKVTRIDVALDYPIDLSQSLMWHDTLRKHARYGSGEHETLYFGAEGGVRHLTVYDKRRERDEQAGQKLGGPLWRFEMHHRPKNFDDPLPPGLFDGVRALDPMEWNKLDPVAYAVARTLIEEPDYLRRFKNPQRRKRWADRLTRLTAPLSPAPADIYESWRDSLRARLHEIEHGFSGVTQTLNLTGAIA
jgi:hypothetical protein